MGYSHSKQAIERVRPLLDAVLIADQRTSIPSTHPQKLAYALREALAASRVAKDEDHKYASLLVKFKLRVKKDRIVFEPRDAVEAGDPVVELIESRQALEVPNVTQVLQIVGACIQHKSDLIFPDAKLNDDEIAQLTKWTSKNGYDIDTSLPLTLTKNGTRAEDGIVKQG